MDTNLFLPQSSVVSHYFWETTPSGDYSGIQVTVELPDKLPAKIVIILDRGAQYYILAGQKRLLSAHPANIAVTYTDTPIDDYCEIFLYKSEKLQYDCLVGWPEIPDDQLIKERIYRGLLAAKMPSTDAACIDVTSLLGELDSPPIQNAIERAIEETEGLDSYTIEYENQSLIIKWFDEFHRAGSTIIEIGA